MRFTFDTVEGFGHLQNEDLIYNPINFWPTPDEQAHALTIGLLPDEASPLTPEPWFASRSVRIDVSKYKPTDTVKRLKNKIAAMDWPAINVRPDVLLPIYEAYCNVKGFTMAFNIEQVITKNQHQKSVIGYYDSEYKLIGFLISRQIGDSSLSLQFAWNYENPKLSLGKVSQYYEIEFARQRGLKYVYLMPGYESGCLYKADFVGVEWYDGKQWRTDTDELKRLMRRDDEFKLIRPNGA